MCVFICMNSIQQNRCLFISGGSDGSGNGSGVQRVGCDGLFVVGFAQRHS